MEASETEQDRPRQSKTEQDVRAWSLGPSGCRAATGEKAYPNRRIPGLTITHFRIVETEWMLNCA